MNLSINDNLPIEIIRTKRRKTVSIQIIKGLVKVIIPEQLSEARVKTLIQKRNPWIRKKLREQSKIIQPKPKEYVSGESFSYLGRNYRLKVIVGTSNEVRLQSGYLEVELLKKSPEQKIRDLLFSWYKNRALERLTEKTNRYAAIMGLTPKSVFIKDYKARWGSCFPDGKISYNWRIIIAPHNIVDYVVVHELCHLKHPNHSPTYWRSVKRVIPEFADFRKWLRDHESELVI